MSNNRSLAKFLIHYASKLLDLMRRNCYRTNINGHIRHCLGPLRGCLFTDNHQA